QVHGIDTQANVGRVLAGLVAAGDLDQLDGRLVEGRGVRTEAAPVGVGLLGDDLALFDESFQHALDVKSVATALEAQGQVFKIDKYGQRPLLVWHARALLPEEMPRPEYTACHGRRIWESVRSEFRTQKVQAPAG